ncbi:MAG: C40 family peptidase [Firmicutes bacterium]|nr:C40 family peptidase [Candidatus Fermentithermobacillaceae bacterium]
MSFKVCSDVGGSAGVPRCVVRRGRFRPTTRRPSASGWRPPSALKASLLVGLVVLLTVVNPVLPAGCRKIPSDSEILQTVQSILAEISVSHKLDEREVVFEINPTVEKRTIALKGKTSEPALKDELISRVSAIEGAKVQDAVEVLPSKSLGDKTFAVVKEPVINLGDGPGRNQGSHVVTQSKIGDILMLLEERDGWYLAQMTADRYLGWVSDGEIWRVDKATLSSYLSGKVALVVAKMTPALGTPGGKEVFEKDLVQGVVLPVKSADERWVAVKLPGRDVAYVKASDVRVFDRLDQVFAEKKGADAVIATAKQYLGLGYLWGGTTAYGFDCSGFTQFCFRMNGYFLRRDADMQYEMGEAVPDRKDLKPGDLVFFQTYKEGPSHVGIYIGDSRFIHASSSRGVAVNSFNPSHPDYSPDLDRKYLGARRIIK